MEEEPGSQRAGRGKHSSLCVGRGVEGSALEEEAWFMADARSPGARVRDPARGCSGRGACGRRGLGHRVERASACRQLGVRPTWEQTLLEGAPPAPQVCCWRERPLPGQLPPRHGPPGSGQHLHDLGQV